MNKTNKDYQFHIKQCQNETRNKNEKDSKCGICSKKFNRIKYVQKHIRGGLISKAIFTLISSSEKWAINRVNFGHQLSNVVHKNCMFFIFENDILSADNVTCRKTSQSKKMETRFF